MKTIRKTPEILHRGSLMTYQNKTSERCFGYMFHFTDHGVYEPTFGRLDVTPEEAATHSEFLSQAQIDGLDQNCEVGMGGMFYTKKVDGCTIVATWLGQEVSREVQVTGAMLTFTRKGMSFRGRLRGAEAECFCFKRIR